MSTVETQGKVLEGEVLFFSAPKGFGFLSRQDGEKDVFVHFTCISDGRLSRPQAGTEGTIHPR